MFMRKDVLVSLSKEKTGFCLSWGPENLFTSVILCRNHPKPRAMEAYSFKWTRANPRTTGGLATVEPYMVQIPINAHTSGQDTPGQYVEADDLPSDILDRGFSLSVNNVSTLKSPAATSSPKLSDEHTKVGVYLTFTCIFKMNIKLFGISISINSDKEMKGSIRTD